MKRTRVSKKSKEQRDTRSVIRVTSKGANLFSHTCLFESRNCLTRSSRSNKSPVYSWAQQNYLNTKTPCTTLRCRPCTTRGVLRRRETTNAIVRSCDLRLASLGTRNDAKLAEEWSRVSRP